jgi:selenocysteine-specific elongation factor
MIFATAGHVDHGKTLLIKALTGVDTDRLPEEKRRNMTIDLGFAYLRTAEGKSLGFIDVPGHDRFIGNMLSGVSSIHAVLLTVAADDGPMPQTFEHIAILDLLGVNIGIVALTKADRVTAEQLAEAEKKTITALAHTTLGGLPIFPVSAMSGQGIREVLEYLHKLAGGWQPRTERGNFRLAIDRCFTIVGAGLVVTGTIRSGSVSVGDEVKLLPTSIVARVRAIHAQNTESRVAVADERCALNLAGSALRKELINRGDWTVAPTAPGAVQRMDARLRILRSERKSFRNWCPVHVHLGAADTTGRVAILEGLDIAPGESRLVQLVLDQHIGAVRGDKFIIRDQSAQRTLGGGQVIDIFAPKRGRGKPDRLAFLAKMEGEDHEAALRSLLETSPNGVNLTNFAANRNLTSNEKTTMFDRISMAIVKGKNDVLAFSNSHWSNLQVKLIEELTACHQRAPDVIGLFEDQLFDRARLNLPAEVHSALLAELVREGSITKDGVYIRLRSHAPKLNAADTKLWNKIGPRLEGMFRPPAIQEIAEEIAEEPRLVASLLIRASRLGLVIRIAKNRFLVPMALHQLAEIVEKLAGENGSGLATAASFRERANIGRNLAIEVLEFFDLVKFTRRVGDAHEVLRPANEAFGTRQSTIRAQAGQWKKDGKGSHPGGALGLQIR